MRANCAMQGHKVYKYIRKSFVRPLNLFGSVADSITEEKVICGRCSMLDSPWIETSRRSIHSLSMPSKDMDEFYDKGRIVMSLVKKRVKHT